MKKTLSLIIICFFNFIMNAQIINFPDVNFKNKLITLGIDTNNDGDIQNSEALTVTTLQIGGSNISNLEGLHYFSNLTALYCSNNLVTQINLCGTSVVLLWCDGNPNLTYLSLKNNVVSPVFILRNQQISTPPPLPYFVFENLPLLTTICYDSGELPAIQYALNTTNIALTTNCTLNCSTLEIDNFNQDFETFKMSPNPVSSILHITSVHRIAIDGIKIYNTLGQLVKTISSSNENKISIDVNELKNGTYFVSIETYKGKSTRKFIKL